MLSVPIRVIRGLLFLRCAHVGVDVSTAEVAGGFSFPEATVPIGGSLQCGGKIPGRFPAQLLPGFIDTEGQHPRLVGGVRVTGVLPGTATPRSDQTVGKITDGVDAFRFGPKVPGTNRLRVPLKKPRSQMQIAGQSFQNMLPGPG